MPQNSTQPQTSNSEDMDMETIPQKLDMLERFIARRFDEISMEINATSQQLDMAEEGIVTKFGEILQVIRAISYSGDGATPANTGIELEAVIDMTEEAANKIIDAAVQITGIVQNTRNTDDEALRNKAFQDIQTQTDEIFAACAFQDLTGQRVKKTLENLKTIEERLGAVLDRLGVPKPDIEDTLNPELQGQVASSQDDIDALFEGA